MFYGRVSNESFSVTVHLVSQHLYSVRDGRFMFVLSVGSIAVSKDISRRYRQQCKIYVCLEGSGPGLFAFTPVHSVDFLIDGSRKKDFLWINAVGGTGLDALDDRISCGLMPLEEQDWMRWTIGFPVD